MTDDELNEIFKAYVGAVEDCSENLSAVKNKLLALQQFSDKLAAVSGPIKRNDILDLKIKMDDMKSLGSAVEKLTKGNLKWVNISILDRLKKEGLENFTRNGMLFYPSTVTYTSVDDRLALEKFALEKSRLDVFGNSLNKEVVNAIKDDTGEYPPGVSTYTQTRLNRRKK